MRKLQCPQCGGRNFPNDLYDELYICQYCFSIFFYENMQKVKHSLILHKPQITLRGKHYKLESANEVKHDNGILTQWTLLDRNNKMFILNEDDENFSLVKEINFPAKYDLNCNALQVNTQITLLENDWLVTDKIKYTTPQICFYQITYLTGENAELLMLIEQNNYLSVHHGFWLDASEINQC